MSTLSAIQIGLLLAIAASFVPQYDRITSQGDCVGLSATSLLLNLNVATQQITVELLHMIEKDESRRAVDLTPTLSDYFNLAQFTVVWLGHMAIFVLYLTYDPSSFIPKAALVFGYAIFLLVSLIPVLHIASMSREEAPYEKYPLHRVAAGFYSLWSFFIVNPIVTAMTFIAYFLQARQLRSRGDIGSLSTIGLAVQAAVFVVVGLSSPCRMVTEGMPFFNWFQLGVWSTVDNLIFALTRGELWCIARRLSQGAGEGVDESTPLTGA